MFLVARIAFHYINSCLIKVSQNLKDGSYSRGPVDIPVGEIDDSKYYLSPTFKFEQVSLSS